MHRVPSQPRRGRPVIAGAAVIAGCMLVSVVLVEYVLPAPARAVVPVQPMPAVPAIPIPSVSIVIPGRYVLAAAERPTQSAVPAAPASRG